MSHPDWKSLFSSHLDSVQERLLAAAEETGFETVVVGSGAYGCYFEDDMHVPFRSNGYFAWTCPLRGPHHLVKFSRGRKPLLVVHAPVDFWSEHEEVGNPFWREFFDVQEAISSEAAWKALGALPEGVFLGNETLNAELHGLATNPERLKVRLNWERSFKTPYEIECMLEANRRAATGHRRAAETFLEGGSEYEIFMALASAMQAQEGDFPYEPIVALNEKGSILHYPNKRRDVRGGKVLLIDAGISFLGYPADITRTRMAPGVNPLFRELVEGLEVAQREICALIRPGLAADALMFETHARVGRLLRTTGLLRGGDVDALAAEGVFGCFMPHGVSHLMGIFVHDVAGKQTGYHGAMRPLAKSGPLRYGRLTRPLEAGNVVSVEPGIYFVPTLLEELRRTPAGDLFDWPRLHELARVGGIRIEDDVCVVEGGHRNLTRPFLPD